MIAVYKKKMRVRDSCERLAALGCAREGRARAAMRVLSVALVALAVTLFLQRYAYADDSGGGGGGHSFEGPNVGIIFYGPVAALDSNANQVNEVGVTAYNVYDAAAYVLGYSYGEVRHWSADIRAKLSNSSTGGSFWQFANTFTHTDNIDGIQWFTANIVYGSDLCWRSLYSDDLFRNALADCQTIINGGDAGGGSGGGSGDGDYWVFDFKANSGNLQNIKTVYVSKEHITFSGNLAGFGDTAMSGVIKFNSYNATSHSISGSGFWLCSDPALTTEVTDGVYSLVESHKDTFFTSISGGTWNVEKIEGESLYVIWSGNSNLTTKYNYSKKFISSATNNAGVLISSGSEPSVPPSNWPDEPAAPSPPELPEPSDPTVDPPEPYDPYDPVVDPPGPYNPTGGDTYIYNITNTTEPTDTSSILEWVKKIFYELKALHSDLSTWVQNLGSALDKLRVTLNNGFTQLYGAIDDVETDIQDVVSSVDNANRQIYNRIGQLGTDLKTEFSSLKQYLRQLFNWLGEKMNFNNEGYDDTSVIYWLKRIWGKLGSGDVNVRPTDPTVNPPAWWEWLNRMLDSLLDGLVGVFNNLLGGTGDLLEEVIHQFPFSIPWDIAAFLTVLAAPPVTPVFDIVIPAIDTWWPEYTIHIDMAPFDTAAATIRLMTKVVFAGCLAWKSRELLDMMDVTKW